MSSIMFYQPIRSDGISLDDQLKFAIRDRLGRSCFSERHTVGQDFIDFLLGFAAGTASTAAKDDVKKLIECINKYKRIEIWEEH